MWRLVEPDATASVTFDLCVNGIRDKSLRARLLDARADVVAAAAAYEAAGRNESLHALQCVDYEIADVSSEEMARVYSNRMVRKGTEGRTIYDQIKLLPKNNLCPLCGHRTVSTLDHFMPKRQFAAIALTPLNLVPVCAECNLAKSAIVSSDPEETILHAYFDDIENDLWLRGRVLERSPASVVFFVDPPEEWGRSTSSRVREHFDRFGLAALYASQAAQHMEDIRYQLELTYSSGGSDSVRDHLTLGAESRARVRTNSWQTALYAALASSAWYCEGGFA